MKILLARENHDLLFLVQLLPTEITTGKNIWPYLTENRRNYIIIELSIQPLHLESLERFEVLKYDLDCRAFGDAMGLAMLKFLVPEHLIRFLCVVCRYFDFSWLLYLFISHC